MFAGIALLIIIIVALPLIKSVVSSTNKNAGTVIENTGTGMANASEALPTMGASFAATTVSDAIAEAAKLKETVGCDDPKVVTMVQLHAWMKANNMM